MIRSLIILSIIWIGLSPVMGQSTIIDDPEEWEKREVILKEWIDNLYVKGVEVDGDSLIIHEEVLLLFQDSNYYSLAFPEEYTWEITIAALKAMQFKMAFWYLTNLYHNDIEANREPVLRTIVAFKDVFEIENLLLSSFYTYGYFSPEYSKIKDGKLDVQRPDLLEQKFAAFKKLMEEVIYFSNQ